MKLCQTRCAELVHSTPLSCIYHPAKPHGPPWTDSTKHNSRWSRPLPEPCAPPSCCRDWVFPLRGPFAPRPRGMERRTRERERGWRDRNTSATAGTASTLLGWLQGSGSVWLRVPPAELSPPGEELKRGRAPGLWNLVWC